MDNILDNTLGLFMLNKARLFYSGRSASASKQQQFFLERNSEPLAYDLKGKAAEGAIRSLLLKDDPCMISRFGSTEMEVLLTYLNMEDKRNFLNKMLGYVRGEEGCALSSHAQKMMHQSGIFPESRETVVEFSKQMLEDIGNIDILGSWLSDDVWFKEMYFPKAVRMPLRDLEPFRSKTPWSEVLAGKKVLVVHPFEASIRKQYAENRERLFTDRCVLPEFELKTLKAVQSIAGNPVAFADWFEAFDSMCQKISNIDFEVAIIGAGGYGLPLAAFVKSKLHKKAVHLGGATQIMFGVKGKKWVESPIFKDLFNQYWINPSEAETPKTFTRVEGGSYW